MPKLTKAEKKERQRLEDEALEQAVKKQSVAPVGIVFFVFFALAAAGTSVYLYTTVMFDLVLMENVYIYGPVVPLVTALLAISSKKVSDEGLGSVLARRRKVGASMKGAPLQAASWSVFLLSSIYLASYLSVTFWLAPNLGLPTTAAYPVSAVAPAAIIFAIVMGYIRQNSFALVSELY